MTALARISSNFKQQDPSSRQRVCYIRTIKASNQLKKMVDVSLKELVTKTN
jgi:hypothetical protein